MAVLKTDGIHLRLYEEIRAYSERFFRKTLPVFKEIEQFRMEVEEETDRSPSVLLQAVGASRPLS
jgi:hypothetical protein